MSRTVVVIGGGLSGLALASELVEEGVDVTVLEKNPYLGGRASNVVDEKTGDPVPIGPHVFMTAYHNLQNFFDQVGAEDVIHWSDHTVDVEAVLESERYPNPTSAMSGPWYTYVKAFDYGDSGMMEKLRTARFIIRAYLMSEDSIDELDDRTVEEYLEEQGIPDILIQEYVRIFVKSLLNIPIDECSAAEFMNLVHDWLHLEERKFGVANGGLGDCYVNAARSFIEDHGGTVHTDTAVKEIVVDEDDTVQHLVVDGSSGRKRIEADTYVSATTPVALRNMLSPSCRDQEFFAHLDAFEGVPYITVFLWFDEKVADRPAWALLDSVDESFTNTDFYDKRFTPGFDRENSLIMSNIIDSRAQQDWSDDEVIEKTLEELRTVYPDAPDPVHTKVNRVPYAVYQPTCGMRSHKRPHRTPINNLYIAGDWTIRDLPQCMEAAVKSGYTCAEYILADDGIEKTIYNPAVK